MENKFKPNGYDNDGNAIQYGFGGQYKPMKDKVIFESEYQLNDFRKHLKLYENVTEEQLMEILKREGYIRKSPVEEAEEMYKNFLHEYENPGVDTSWSNTVACIKTQHEAIQYLKAENERLKK